MRRTRVGPVRWDEGWTFVEAIVVIAIIVLLTGTVAFSAVKYVERARRASAEIQIESFGLALQAYYLDSGRFPGEEQGLRALWEEPVTPPSPPNWSGPYTSKPVDNDPWGNPFVYRLPGPGGLPYEIISYGADGLPGGEASDADISSAE